MSDIPDWLVELAAQRDDEEEEAAPAVEAASAVEAALPDEAVVDEVESEWDFLQPSPAAPADAVPAAEETDDWDAFVRGVAAPAPAEEDGEGEIVEVLRSQVESAEKTPAELAVAPAVSSGRGMGGLLPWQQAVLAILLLLDVAVIGFLFLVMLGKMSIG